MDYDYLYYIGAYLAVHILTFLFVRFYLLADHFKYQ